MSDHLRGVRVVEFGQYIAAPGAASLLRSLGAEIFKVEPLHGEQTRHLGSFGAGMFSAYNRGKHAIALNLRDNRGREVARRLIASADVVIENMRPGQMIELGLGPADARAINHSVIFASISGFNPKGLAADRPGLDIAAQAESGIMSLTGEFDGEAQRVGFAVVDASAANYLAQAILASLFRRIRSGEGERIELSLLDVGIHMQSAIWAEYFSTGVEPKRRGNGQANVAPAADMVRTKDGWLVLSAYTPAAWSSLCSLIGHATLSTDPRFVDNQARVANRPALKEILSEFFKQRTSSESVSELNEAGIVAGAVYSYSQILKAPHIASTGIFQGLDSGEPTSIPCHVATPYTFDGLHPVVEVPEPMVGEHSRQVLSVMGYQEDEIDSLISEGVVA